MIAEHDCSRRCCAHEAKNLRGLAIKSFAEITFGGIGSGPPIAFHSALAVYVTHWDEG